MVKADKACYAAKHNGRKLAHVWNQKASIESIGSHRVELIETALKKNQYKLLMQPIESVSGDDALSRYELTGAISQRQW